MYTLKLRMTFAHYQIAIILESQTHVQQNHYTKIQSDGCLVGQ